MVIQSTIVSYVSPGRPVLKTETVVEDRRKRQRATCLELGIPWPIKLPRKRRGRPSRECLWLEAVYRAIMADSVPEGMTLQCPKWWRRGDPLVRRGDDVEFEMSQAVAAVQQADNQGDAQVDEAAVQEATDEVKREPNDEGDAQVITDQGHAQVITLLCGHQSDNLQENCHSCQRHCAKMDELAASASTTATTVRTAGEQAIVQTEKEPHLKLLLLDWCCPTTC